MIKDFYLISHDYLELLAKKKKQGEKNIFAKKEFDVLDAFWTSTQMIIQNGEIQVHGIKLEAVNEHIKAKLLEKELRDVYNTLYKSKYAGLDDLLITTKMPSKKELEKSVFIKNKTL